MKLQRDIRKKFNVEPESNDGELDYLESESDESNECGSCFWNLNAIAVICLKGTYFRESRTQNNSASSRGHWFWQCFDPMLLRLSMICFAMIFSICMVVILAGLQDQFLAIKSYIYGDGIFYSYSWRYPRTSTDRDRFSPVLAPNGTLLGYTADILGPHRPASEAQRCLKGGPLWPFNELHWSPNRTAAAVWRLVDSTSLDDLNWTFPHCIAWEYANLCAAVMEADQERDAAPPPPPPRARRPDQCYLEATDGRAVSLDEWRGLSAPPDELRAASAAALAPRRVEARLDLALWITTVLVSNGKDPSSTDDDWFSTFLSRKLSYLYVLGVGDAYVIEVVTVMTLFFYLYATAFFGEVLQLIHQVAAARRRRRRAAANPIEARP